MTLLIFFAVLSVLVLAHEWGHFVTARRAGAKVEEFGFGFPPKLFSLKKNGIVYSFNLIPFGGFVKIFGEDGEHANESGSFASLKLSKRAKIIIAGVTMNIILAILLLGAGNLIGRPEVITDENFNSARDVRILVLQVQPGSPAQIAGIKNSDEIISVKLNNQISFLKTVENFQEFILTHQGKKMVLNLKRADKLIEVAIEPRINPPSGQGALGISLARVGLVKTPWYLAFVNAFKETFILMWVFITSFIMLLKTLISQGRLAGEIVGPVGIATLAGQAYQMGWAYLIQLTALLSINLAILNILPFPALDGGKLIFLAVEKIKGSPMSRRFEQSVNMVGFGMLLLLMLVLTWKDVVKLF